MTAPRPRSRAVAASLASLAMLAACGQPAPAPAPTATATSAGYGAKVAALPARQRAGVLLRAIRDAGQDCQGVVDATLAEGSAPPAWVATCDDHRRWVVAIADDGTAIVADAKDVARPS